VGSALLLFGCQQQLPRSGASADDERQLAEQTVSEVDLSEIKERGKLVALLNYSSTSYFIYRGKPMGFEYELLKHLAKDLGVDLEIKLANDLNEITDMLLRGKGDVIAQGLTVTKGRKAYLDFTKPTLTTRQVLVQKKPTNWRSMTERELDELLIRNTTELAGKEIYVRQKSSYHERLQNLSDEIGEDITLKPAPGNLQTEELIRLVAEGKISYTVADENIARVQKTYFSNIDISTPVSFTQKIAWAVRESSPQLKAAINSWLTEMKRTARFNNLYAKYFKDPRSFKRRIKSDYYSKAGGQLSEYDPMIKKYANRIDWDWRLLASLMYQESRFNPDAESWAGAKGLMQVMPVTGNLYGITNLYHPESNMRAGIAYLSYLKKYWKVIPDSIQRVKFILASYNAGHGHVADARRLAKKYGKNPNVWDKNVEEFILKKSKPEYFNDEVVKYGYVRGIEPYSYVQLIIERYKHYEEILNEQKGFTAGKAYRTAWLDN